MLSNSLKILSKRGTRSLASSSKASPGELLRKGDHQGALARLEELRDAYVDQVPLVWNSSQTPGGRWEEWVQGYASNPTPEFLLPALLDLRDSWPDYIDKQRMEIAMTIGAVSESVSVDEMSSLATLLHPVSAPVYEKLTEAGSFEALAPEDSALVHASEGLFDAVYAGLRLGAPKTPQLGAFLNHFVDQAVARQSEATAAAAAVGKTDKLPPAVEYFEHLKVFKGVEEEPVPEAWGCVGIDLDPSAFYEAALVRHPSPLVIGRYLNERLRLARFTTSELETRTFESNEEREDAILGRRAALLSLATNNAINHVRGLWMRYGILGSQSTFRRLVTLAAAWPRYANDSAFYPDGTEWSPREGEDTPSIDTIKKEDPLAIRYVAAGMPPDILSPVATDEERVKRPLHSSGFIASRLAAWTILAGARFHVEEIPKLLVNLNDEVKKLAHDEATPSLMGPLPKGGDSMAPQGASADDDDCALVGPISAKDVVTILDGALIPTTLHLLEHAASQMQEPDQEN